MSHHHQGIPTLNWNSDKIPTLLHVCGGLDEEDGNGADQDDDLGTDQDDVLGTDQDDDLGTDDQDDDLGTDDCDAGAASDDNVLEKNYYTSGEDGGLFA